MAARKGRNKVEVPKDLEQLGLRTELMKTIRLGKGAIGKASWVMGLLLLVLLAIAIRMPEDRLLELAFVIAGMGALYLVFSSWIAHKQPGLALLEGAELIQYEQIQADAAKGLPEPPKSGNVFDPSKPLPIDIEEVEIDEAPKHKQIPSPNKAKELASSEEPRPQLPKSKPGDES